MRKNWWELKKKETVMTRASMLCLLLQETSTRWKPNKNVKAKRNKKRRKEKWRSSWPVGIKNERRGRDGKNEGRENMREEGEEEERAFEAVNEAWEARNKIRVSGLLAGRGDINQWM